MSSVQVHLFAAARAAVGAREIHTQAETLGELCDALAAEHPAFTRIRPQCSYLINEVAVHGDPYATTLQPGDRIDILPPFAGGAQ